MKLIKILALTAALATMASAQNPGGSNPQPGSKSSAATPTPAKTASPAATKAGAKPQPVTAVPTTAKTSATAKKQSGTTKGTTAKTGTPAGKAGAPPVITATPKAAQASTKAGTAPQAKPSPVPAMTSGKVKPTIATKKSGQKKSTAPVSTGKKKSTKSPVTVAKKPKAQPKLAEVTPPEKPEKKKGPPRLLGAAGRRDPFVSPIRAAVGAQGPGAGCTSGKRCLAIPELVLRGTVRDISGKMLAVVANSAQRTYTLRENDQVFNGSVEKITSDSIIFREFVKDALGRETAREVVKKLGPAS